MTEIFKPRENMTYEEDLEEWTCRDEDGNFVCDGGPSVIGKDGLE